MNEPSYSQRILDLPCKVQLGPIANGSIEYICGHRDARHAAAELAAKADATISDLLEALKRAQVLASLVTIRQVINAGDEAIDAAGLNPYCMNEGLATGSERIGTWFIEVAIENATLTSLPAAELQP